MPEDILVVEYEPRYTERVRQALSGQPFNPRFAKDGEEALHALTASHPRLIVVSAMLPRISTPELVRAIRGRSEHERTPILVTVSGYNGKSPKADAVRYGADDLLPKPYSEGEFLSKVHQLLGVKSEPAAPGWAPAAQQHSAPPTPMPDDKSQQLTSNEIFGDILDDEKRAPKKPSAKVDDLDKMLADTLSGVRTPGKKAPPSPPPSDPQQPAKTKSTNDIDRLLHDTLSGLEKSGKKSTADSIPVPKPAPKIESRPAPAPPVEDNIQLASPILLPKKEEPRHEEFDETGVMRFGQYNLLEKIAVGGMAEVWKARMRGVEGFQKIVAIKKILPHLSDNEEFVTMFIDEAKLAAQLNHNNIIHIYDLGKIANSYYIAMEYIDGADLKTILKRGDERGQPMAIELALFIASKIASALDYAHRKRDFHEKDMGLVHRDVSPQNVLISHEGDIKLCDFGIAKAASKASHTQAGALKGKLQYMSPEQAWGRPIDRRADIFALATVLFEMLTGHKLFSGDNEMSVLEQVREARVVAPSTINDEISPEIDAIVLKALGKESEARYQTAGELAKDLDTILYTFRPTPTSADLAIYMHRLFSEEAVSEAVHHAPAMRIDEHHSLASVADDEIIIPPPIAPPPGAMPHGAAAAIPHAPAHHPPRTDEHLRARVEEKKKPPIVPIAVGIIALLGIAGAAVVVMNKKPAAPAQAQPTAATKAPPVAAQTQTVPIPADNAAMITPDTATTTTASGAASQRSIPTDQTLIDQEVRKRLEAERAKLEQQRQQQLATERARQTQSQREAESSTVAVEQPSSQQAAPAQQQTTATVAESRPEPAQSAPATNQTSERPVREGDLIETGTPGLIAPELLNFRKPAYPPIAKMRRVQGVVVLSVLVSETGKPLDVKLLRGVKENVGINEAAVEAMRGATFKPGTKDGVRVKAYKTVSIPFTL